MDAILGQVDSVPSFLQICWDLLCLTDVWQPHQLLGQQSVRRAEV